MGCPFEVRIYNPQEKNIDHRTISENFIEYAERSKGFRFSCPSSSIRIVESRNAKFLENDLISGSDQFQNTISIRDEPSTSSQRLIVVIIPLKLNWVLRNQSMRFHKLLKTCI